MTYIQQIVNVYQILYFVPSTVPGAGVEGQVKQNKCVTAETERMEERNYQSAEIQMEEHLLFRVFSYPG